MRYDPTGRVTRYEYDTGPLTRSIYDADGNPVITTYQYDPNFRLTGDSNGATTDMIYTQALPAPGGALLFVAALAGLGALRRRAIN